MKERGFKQSEIGLIPEDWELRPIDTSFDFVRNNTLSRDSMSNVGEVVNIHYGDVLIKYGAWVNVSTDQVGYINSSIRTKAIHSLQNGDVVMADTAEDETAGKCCEIVGAEGIQVEAGLHTFVLRPKDKYAPKFLGYAFNAAVFHDQLIPHMQGTKVTSISKNAVGKTYLLCPPVAEQEMIAKAISDVDELINGLDNLIIKKRGIKQGTMQMLLSGKQRLSGYSDDWKEYMLGNIGETFNGITGKSAKDFGHGNAKYITFLNVLNNTSIETAILESVDIKEGEKQNTVQYGDLFFNTSSETPEEVGMCATLLQNVENTYLNSFCFGFRLNNTVKILPLYLAYWFRTRQGRCLMSVLAQGSTRYNLSKEGFKKGVVTLPSYNEQKAILTILTDMDKEIVALEAKRDKYLHVKQGMMQELLTGKTRLV